MSDSLWPHELYSPWHSPGQNTGVCTSPGDLPNPAIEPRFPTLQADSLPAEPQIFLSYTKSTTHKRKYWQTEIQGQKTSDLWNVNYISIKLFRNREKTEQMKTSHRLGQNVSKSYIIRDSYNSVLKENIIKNKIWLDNPWKKTHGW